MEIDFRNLSYDSLCAELNKAKAEKAMLILKNEDDSDPSLRLFMAERELFIRFGVK